MRPDNDKQGIPQLHRGPLEVGNADAFHMLLKHSHLAVASKASISFCPLNCGNHYSSADAVNFHVCSNQLQVQQSHQEQTYPPYPASGPKHTRIHIQYAIILQATFK